ncbi:MAG: AMP-binding protein [Acidimicrobiales bacterium]|nr:AMP-binding protein [Acidimicrobiales bacterium]
MSLGFFNFARDDPDGLALVDAQRKLTWAEFDQRVNRIGHALLDSGLGRGDHLAMVMGNRSEFMEVLGACLKTGMILTPVNWHFNGDEASYVVDDCDARALIVDTAYLAAGTVCASLSQLALRLVTGDEPQSGLESYEHALAAASSEPLPVDGEPGGFMLYTSGTTGRPKGVQRQTAPPGSTVEAMLSVMAMMGGRLGVEPGGAHLLTGPLYHAAPLGFGSMAFNAGNTLVMMDQWAPETTLELMTEWRVTNTHMVPTMFVRLLRLPEETRAGFDPTHLQAVIHGAAPCPVWAKEQMIQWWGPVIKEYYGATEGGITIIDADEWLTHKGSVGRTLPVYQVEIRDDDGDLMPTGETGTVWFRSLLGGETFRYYKDEAKTAAAHAEPGVFTLGDVGRLDDEGYLWLTDRKSDLIISGGVNIYPAEVEQVLTTHPAVADVAVFGIPDDEWGEQVKAAVELVPGHDGSAELAAELIEFCRQRLAHFKCPRSVDFEAELPRHTTGKLYKRLLRDRYWDREGKFI